MEGGAAERMNLVPASERECRICFDKGEGRYFGANAMIAPCLCKGTSQWVHRSCLDQWRQQSLRSFTHCRECGFEYRLRHDNGEGKFTKQRFRMLIARDFLIVFAVLMAFLSCTAYMAAAFDRGYWFAKLLNGEAKWHFPTYFFVGMVGSLASLGLAASSYQVYAWQVLGEPLNMINWQTCCCSQSCGPCCDCRYMTFWDWYWCMHLFENCMRGARHSAGSIRREDMHIAAVAALVAVAVFAIIGIFVGTYFAAALGQMIFNNHAQMLRRRVLTKEYVVEDLDGMDVTRLPPVEVQVLEDDMVLIGQGYGRGAPEVDP